MQRVAESRAYGISSAATKPTSSPARYLYRYAQSSFRLTAHIGTLSHGVRMLWYHHAVMINLLLRTVHTIFYWRWSLLFGGFVLISFGIALMVQSNAGLGPWDVLHQGISKQTGIPIGMVTIVVAAPIMLGWIPLGERPGIGTLLNMVLIGILIDLFLFVLPPTTWLPAQIAQMAAGVVLVGIGAGFYLGAGLGAGPRDGLMIGLVRRTGLSVRLIRTLMELTVLAIGWVLGGSVGIGTLAFAFGIGPVIQMSLRVSRQLVPDRQGKTS